MLFSRDPSPVCAAHAPTVIKFAPTLPKVKIIIMTLCSRSDNDAQPS